MNFSSYPVNCKRNKADTKIWISCLDTGGRRQEVSWTLTRNLLNTRSTNGGSFHAACSGGLLFEQSARSFRALRGSVFGNATIGFLVYVFFLGAYWCRASLLLWRSHVARVGLEECALPEDAVNILGYVVDFVEGSCPRLRCAAAHRN